VVERLAAAARGFDEDAQILFVLRLADVIGKRARAERAIEVAVIAARCSVNWARGHRWFGNGEALGHRAAHASASASLLPRNSVDHHDTSTDSCEAQFSTA
jgi:hypothetical protein